MALICYRRYRSTSPRIRRQDPLARHPPARVHSEYGGIQYTKHKLACKLFEQPYVTSKTVQRLFGVEQPTASRAINQLVDEGVLEEVTGNGRNKEYRAREIFDILEQPPQTY